MAAAAQSNVITVTFDGTTGTPATLLAAIEEAVGDHEVESIAFATHDLGEARFDLVGSYSVSPSSLAGDSELQAFWEGVGALLTADGRVDLLACNLASTDAGGLLISQIESLTGHEVAASDNETGNTAAGGDWILEEGGVDVATTYFVYDWLDSIQGTLEGEEKLVADDGAEWDFYGSSVSISGDWAVVGAPDHDYSDLDNSGAVYIYVRTGSGTDWTLVKELGSTNAIEDGRFGTSVSISGDYLIVGATGEDPYDASDGLEGAVYIYMRDQGGTDNWGLVKEIDGPTGDNYTLFGCSVSISGDYAIVGASYLDCWVDGVLVSSAGGAFIYEQDEGGTNNWGLMQEFFSSDPQAVEHFGTSVCISGDMAIIGSPYTDIGTLYNAGKAFVFQLDGSDIWRCVAQLTAEDPALQDCFGWSVAISGDCAAVGAPYHDVGGLSDAGAVYVFCSDRGGTNAWGQVAMIVSPDVDSGEDFGYSVAMAGDYLAVGAWQSDLGSAYSAGEVTVFSRDQGGNDCWGDLVTYHASDYQTGDNLGYSVAISGSDVIAGAYSEDEVANGAGAAYIFPGPIDAPPVILPAHVPTVTGYEDQQSNVFWLKASDVDDPSVDEVNFVVNGQVIDNAGGTTVNVLHGTITAIGAVVEGTNAYMQAFVFTPDADYWGEFDTSYYFTSTSSTQSDTKTLNFDISATNDQPSVVSTEVPQVTVDEDAVSGVFTLTAHDPDNVAADGVNFVVDGNTIDNSGASTVSVTNGTLNVLGGVTSDGNGTYTQQFTFTPNPDFYGVIDLSYYFKTPAPTKLQDTGQTLGSSTSHYCVALADLDGDGDVDMVLGGGGTPIWLNDGLGNFSYSEQSLGSSGTYALALGDIDGDGDVDIVQGTGGNTKIFLNNGYGVFSDSGTTIAVSGANGLALGDVNDDGLVDLVVANDSGLTVWLSDGKGAFYSSGQTFTSGTTNVVALADMNEDGYLDIVSDNGGLHVSLNNGNGSFAEPTDPIAGHARCIALADFNGDDYLDILEGHGSLSHAVFSLNDGTGTTFTRYTVSAGFNYASNSVATLDVNGDGSLDDTFDGDGKVITDLGGSEDLAYSLAIQSDGKILVTGVTNAGSSKDFVLLRYNSDGSLDTTFDGDGIATTDVSGGYADTARGIAIQDDGLIVVAGYAYDGSQYEFAVARYNCEGGPLQYTEGDPPSILQSVITISDLDNLNMESATIQITGNYQMGADVLAVETGYLAPGVTQSWDAATGTLTLTGSASKADYEVMLEHVTYENTSDDPSTLERTVTWSVDDGTDHSALQTNSIFVTCSERCAGD